MQKEAHLGFVHSFRGFAILNIVAIHAMVYAMLIPGEFDLDPTAPLYILNETLFHDSTIYFALISGLLFSTTLQERGYKKFYGNKMRNVLMPYLFCSAFFSLFLPPDSETSAYTLRENSADYFQAFLHNVVTGEAQFTYWYIPVLFILFALTPALDYLCRAKGSRALPLWLILTAPLVFSRPEFSPGASLISFGGIIYFAGAYTTGMFLGKNLQSNMDWLADRKLALVVIAALSSIAIAIMHRLEFWGYAGLALRESTYYVQKIALAALVLVWLRHRSERQPRALGFFANHAFAIYFLHVAFIELLVDPMWDYYHLAHLQPWSIITGGIFMLLFALAMSILAVMAARQVLGSTSRMVIGS